MVTSPSTLQGATVNAKLKEMLEMHVGGIRETAIDKQLNIGRASGYRIFEV